MDCVQGLSTLTLVDLNLVLAKLALERLKKYAKVGVRAGDSVILATMGVMNVTKIATHDDVFKQIEELKVIDPILKKL